jgi:hypothetical protein
MYLETGGKGETNFLACGIMAHIRLPRQITGSYSCFSPEDRERSQHLFRALRGDLYSTFPGMESCEPDFLNHEREPLSRYNRPSPFNATDLTWIALVIDRRPNRP